MIYEGNHKTKIMFTVVNNSFFSEWLQQELSKRGWAQSELARRAGLTRGAISSLVSGRNNPKAETCVAIARAFDLPPETVLMAADLLPEIPPPGQDPTFTEILNVVKNMNPEERAELLDYALFRFRKRK